MIATSSFLTALECTKSIFGRGSAPDPAGGAYSAPPDPLAGFKGSYFFGMGGEGRERGGKGGEGKEKGGEARGEEGKGRRGWPSNCNSWIRP